MSAIYPWSAVVGQERLKLALLLSAIDPGLGGVLVRGPRGVAKTTLARALAELVPGRFVELPLGATEERVVGTLDLGAALRDGKVGFAEGLLARAHDGVLYVDEINLLPDSLVDLLLDVSSSGVNVVERDGISHRHAARFVLVGTMNPEEGELRPQLIDRFGLSVAVPAGIAPRERAAIVARRLEFERDPERFRARFADAQRELAERCCAARARTQQIAVSDEVLARVTERCHGAGVEGVRADLAMLRAARAHAAWNGRTHIAQDDVDAVAELALAHRRTAPSDPSDRGSSGGGGSSSAADRGAGTATTDGDHGAMPAVPVRALAAPELPSWMTTPAPRCARDARVDRSGRGRLRLPSRSIDWFATLARARSPRARELRYRLGRLAHGLLVLAIDCSASMLRGGALSAAKGMARACAAHARRARSDLALIAFSGVPGNASRAARVQRSSFERVLAGLGAGGGTPLRSALVDALAIGRSAGRRGATDRRLLVLTDGRSRERVADLMHMRSTFDLALIDCERARLRLGGARRIARDLRARYAHVDALERSEVFP